MSEETAADFRALREATRQRRDQNLLTVLRSTPPPGAGA